MQIKQKPVPYGDERAKFFGLNLAFYNVFNGYWNLLLMLHVALLPLCLSVCTRIQFRLRAKQLGANNVIGVFRYQKLINTSSLTLAGTFDWFGTDFSLLFVQKWRNLAVRKPKIHNCYWWCILKNIWSGRAERKWKKLGILLLAGIKPFITQQELRLTIQSQTHIE